MTRSDHIGNPAPGARSSPWRRLSALWRRRAERRRLMTLGERLLKDIGIGYGDAYREYAKPCWRP